jgi:hypothetical protein
MCRTIAIGTGKPLGSLGMSALSACVVEMPMTTMSTVFDETVGASAGVRTGRATMGAGSRLDLVDQVLGDFEQSIGRQRPLASARNRPRSFEIGDMLECRGADRLVVVVAAKHQPSAHPR